MTCGAPLIIVLTSSAKRASEIKSHLGDFCSSEEVVKICAKNSKVEDHVTYLSGHVVHIVLATPNRLFKLIEAGALKLHQLKLLVVDWYWRNLKLKCFKDIPEVWSDFILLYITYINRLVQDNQCKIGLL
jgi:superfamily II DNA/RNA helicase